MKFTTLFLAALAAVLLPLAATAGEGRTPIWEPLTITDPGRYIVTRNVVAGGPVIVIGADGVDIDLNGFVLDAAGGLTVIESFGHSNIAIRNGVLTGASESIRIASGKNIVIEDVHSVFSGGDAFVLTGVTDFALRRNQISDAGGTAVAVDPFGFAPSSSGVMADNQIERCGLGITVEGGSSVTLERNRVVNASLGHGIRIGGSSGVLLTQNTVRETVGHGIWLQSTNGAKLHNNVVGRAGFIGIELGGGSSSSLVLDNVVSESGGPGMFIAGDGNHIERNVLSRNGLGGGGFGLHLVGGAAEPNVYRGNTATGNFGPPAACPFPVSADFCDATGGANTSALSAIGGDNMMPFPL